MSESFTGRNYHYYPPFGQRVHSWGSLLSPLPRSPALGTTVPPCLETVAFPSAAPRWNCDSGHGGKAEFRMVMAVNAVMLSDG